MNRVLGRSLAAAPGRAAGRLAGLLLALAAAVGQAAVVAPVTATLSVDMGDEIAAGRFDPVSDRVGLRGGHPPLSWQQPLLLRPVGQGRYATTLRFDRLPFGGQAMQYKFRIERAGQDPDAGWEQGANHLLQLDGPAPQLARRFNDPPAAPVLRRTGTIERLGPVGSAPGLVREVQVWLPPGYHRSPDRRHPVLYLHDGQNVFDAASAGAEWQADETAQRLTESGAIDAPIIVAVHSGNDRLLDFTPSVALLGADRSGTGQTRRQGGGAPAYAAFLADVVKPLIDGRYRTRPDAASTSVGGSSLGGLVSLWLALHRGDVFGAALVVSPSLWWDDEFARRDLRALPMPAAPRPRLWLDMGAHEGEQALPAARRLRDALRGRGWSDATLAYAEDAQGGHDETSWASRFEAMLMFLYAQPRLPR